MKVSISDLADKSNIKFGTIGLRGLVTDLSDELADVDAKIFTRGLFDNDS